MAAWTVIGCGALLLGYALYQAFTGTASGGFGLSAKKEDNPISFWLSVFAQIAGSLVIVGVGLTYI